MSTPPPIEVDCYSGYRGEEAPRRFRLGGRVHEVKRVLRRWREPNAEIFEIETAEGRRFTLRRERARGWTAE